MTTTWIKAIFSKLGGLFRRAPVDKVLEISKAALPYVRTFAALTPTRADDELIRLFEQYALPNVEKWLAFPERERGVALAWGVAELMAQRYPSTPTRVIRWAVETAYNLYREDQERQEHNLSTPE